MVRLIQIEEIEQLLLQLPSVVELQEAHPAAFVARAAMWMDLLEQALVTASAKPAGRVAVLRGGLVLARHTSARDSVEPRAQLTRVRRLATEAAAALDEAATIATELAAKYRPSFDDADRRLTDLVARARSAHLLPATEPAITSHVRLEEVRSALSRNRDLWRIYVAVEYIVGPDDAQFMLGRALSGRQSTGVANGRQ